MALPINVEDLLMQRKVKSNRIEFKNGGILTESADVPVRFPSILIISENVLYSSKCRKE